MFCSHCGKEIDNDAVVCVHCGCAVNKEKLDNLVNTSDRKWTTTLLLCLFLGGFGAHRFYTGHKGTAIVMLVLAISIVGAPVAGIWALIDFIQILTHSFKTASGEKLQE